MINKKIKESGWEIETTINNKSQDIRIDGETINGRILQQIITSPDGSKIRVEQHISNSSDYHNIDITKV